MSLLRNADELVEIGVDGSRGASKAKKAPGIGRELAGEAAKPLVERGVRKALDTIDSDSCDGDCCQEWAYSNGGGWCCAFWDSPSSSVNIISRPGETMQCRPPMRRVQGDTVWCCMPP